MPEKKRVPGYSITPGTSFQEKTFSETRPPTRLTTEPPQPLSNKGPKGRRPGRRSGRRPRHYRYERCRERPKIYTVVAHSLYIFRYFAIARSTRLNLVSVDSDLLRSARSNLLESTNSDLLRSPKLQSLRQVCPITQLDPEGYKRRSH